MRTLGSSLGIASVLFALWGCLGESATFRNAAGLKPSEAEAEECYQKATRATVFADTLRACLGEKGYRPVKDEQAPTMGPRAERGHERGVGPPSFAVRGPVGCHKVDRR